MEISCKLAPVVVYSKTMSDSAKTYALMATMAERINNTNGKFLCLMVKAPNGYIDVYLDNVPVEGLKLNEAVDELKAALKRLQQTIQKYEDKNRFNG